MLLWEHLDVSERDAPNPAASSTVTAQTRRLPYDHRCSAMTKSGRRCRGRILPGREHCMIHDAEASAKRNHGLRRSGSRAKLARLPDGYLRKITNRRSVGEAMDRLYREIRLGIITPEMGRVLFDVLTRLLDSGLADAGVTPRAPQRSKASRLRPRVSELLTRAERRAWNLAVTSAPQVLFDDGPSRAERRDVPLAHALPVPAKTPERALTLPLQAAS